MLEFDDIEDEFSDAESLEAEIEILDESYRNAYAIAIGKVTVKELLERSKEMIFLPFDPSNPETFTLIVDDIIDYFESTEEYEKCSELIKIKKKFDDLR
jgi:hypothetical protein